MKMPRHSHSILRIFGPGVICCLLTACIFTDTALAGKDGVSTRHRGIRIQALAPDPDRKFDSPPMAGSQAVEKIKAALDLIREKSPGHREAIDKIRQQGQVYLVYNPNYPSRQQDLAQIRVALFMPFYVTEKKADHETPVPVLISRHGIKWPVPELAAVIVHELVGHGGQYLKGLTDKLRTSELECQAWLLQELAHQNFGLDKTTKEMIRFRQQLSGVGSRNGYCTPFFKYLSRRYPEKKPLYAQLNPDVQGLLPLLDRFIRDLAASGTTRKALAAANAVTENRLTQLETAGTARQLYGTGLFLLEGAGYRQDLERGARFIRLSAEKNYPAAQVHLAELYSRGRGITRNLEQAYFWLTVAARNSHDSTRQKILARRRELAGRLEASRRWELEARAASRAM